MMYYKIIGDRTVFSDCSTIQTNNGQWISNPSIEQIHAAGWMEYTPPEIPHEEPDLEEVMAAVKKMLSSSVENLSDEDALAVAALYPTWASMIGEPVTIGVRLWYNEKLWRVVQPHTVQDNWKPDEAVSLYTEVSVEEWPEIVIPIPSTNPYMVGDKVTYNGNHYICQIDNCVWTPDEYPSAWQLVA